MNIRHRQCINMLDMQPASTEGSLNIQIPVPNTSHTPSPSCNGNTTTPSTTASEDVQHIKLSDLQGMDFYFKSKKLEALYTQRKGVQKYEPGVVDAFFKVMQRISAAQNQQDLQVLPSRNLEKLKGNRANQHSLRLNQQWRLIIIFEEDEIGPIIQIVEIVDYH